MHINYYQYKHYSGKLKDGASFILLTPKEGLSMQHNEEFFMSNISAEIYNKALSRGFVYNVDSIQIIENTKLAKKDGEKTVAISRFGNENVVFVDEGHRGASGDTWYKYRNELCENGFSFEYSATFGQAVSEKKDLIDEYAKCIIFDYSYKYFYEDGYGKDYNILNLNDESDNKYLKKIYLTASLVSFYQQKKLFISKKKEFSLFNIENPLMIFVGTSVNAVKKINGKDVSDIIDIVSFYNEFIENKNESVNNIKRILEHTTGIVDSLSRDVFRNSFRYLEELNLNADTIFDDILKIVFNSNTKNSLLHIENIKGIDGEISLRLGENEPFGVINVGDDSRLMKLLEKNKFNTGTIDFKESLFNNITKAESKINLLIGSKKFTEGWNCWRVSSIGLLNVGRNEGSEIIQLFGRGVRLKGYNMSLMRTEELKKKNIQIDVPEYISILETLNVFGVRADYMRNFKEYLEKEGVPIEKSTQYVVDIPIIKNEIYKLKKLYSLQLKDGLNYKNDAERLVLKLDSRIKIELDCYGKIQFETSSYIGESQLSKDECKLKKEHLEFINLDELYLELEEYKNEKNINNLIISRENIKEFLDNNYWYNLKIPKNELDINTFEDYKKFENIVITLLKLYMDRFYKINKESWENNYLIYKQIDEKYENFIEEGKYRISILDTENNQELIKFVEKIKDEIHKAKVNKDLNDFNDKIKGQFSTITLDNSLYNPLIYVAKKEKDINVFPAPLVESEKRFVFDLKKYISEKLKLFNNKEIYLIRNIAKKGVGFFETVGFYPDFILWVLEGNKQFITFVEPHGMVYESINSEKVKLHKKIKDIQNRINDSNITLNSIILYPFDLNNIIEHHSKEEWNNENVFSMMDQDYLEKLFECILN